MKKSVLKLLLLLLVVPMYAQQGGMWIPSLLKGRNESEMKSLGMKISAKDIYDVNHSSLKDAVPHFDGGCTAEVISDKGLILTNHHCGFGEIQSHSTVENDYLANGFWAMNMQQELVNKDLEVTFIIKIEDVTKLVMEGTSNMSEADRQLRMAENIKKIIKNSPKEAWQENRVKTFFDGNQYLLFVVESFKDVRLVGAPPSAIGKFGSDTDNWVWPRHTGDFSLFRIYADKNNRPAAYSPDNVPYKPKHFFPVSIKGINDNDFSMVMGYPGRTQEYLPSFAVAQILNDLNPAKIEVRDMALKAQDAFMRKNQAIKIQYAAKYASIANYWKKWIGESKGLKKSNALDIKRNFEKNFAQKVITQGKQAEYGNLLADFEINYTEIAPYSLAKDYFTEIVLRNTETFLFAYRIYQLEQVYKSKGEQAFADRKAKTIDAMKDAYKDYSPEVDQKVMEQLLAVYAKKYPAPFMPNVLKEKQSNVLVEQIFKSSKITSYDGFKSLLQGDGQTVFANLANDPAYALVKEMAEAYNNQVLPKYEELNLKITALQRNYMKAILELFPNDRIFPDANSTLRVTYGKVKGYNPTDAVTYQSKTYLDGVMEKYIPGDYEFDVPKKLIELYNKKDFGPYAENGKMPVCYLATNHTTGGNSGSPALDANGNLVGLNFDRVWEGTMSDIHYDPAICRNIMVDIRYVLFIIDKYAGAKNLIQELKIVGKK